MKIRRIIYILFFSIPLLVFYSCSGGGSSFGGGQTTVSNVSSSLKIYKAFPVEENKIAVKFSEPIDPNSAQDKSNYVLSGSAFGAPKRVNGGNYPKSVEVLPDNQTVILTTESNMKKSSNFSISISGVKSLIDGKDINSSNSLNSSITVSTMFLPGADLFPPNIDNVSIGSSKKSILIKYDELVDPTSAMKTSNYSIKINGNDVSLSDATIDYSTLFESNSFKTLIKISLDSIISAVDGDSLDVSSSDISDIASTPNSGSSSVNSTVDMTSPMVDTKETTFLNATTIKVAFSEEMDEESVENPENYYFDHGITAITATLLSDKKTVQITTSNMVPGMHYQGEVRNVYDLSLNAIDSSHRDFTIYYSLDEPQDVQAVYLPDSNQTKITWTDDPEGVTYKVYRSTSQITKSNIDSLVPLTTTVTQNTQFYIYNVPASTEGYYYYAVVSVQSDGSEDKKFSGSNSMKTPVYEDNIIPEAPTAVTASYDFGSNITTISWTDATTDDSELYRILRYSSPINSSNFGSADIIADDIARNTQSYNYTVPSNTAGTYYYAVLSYDATGNSDTSFSGTNTSSVYEDNVNELTPLAYFKVLPGTGDSLEIYFKTPNDTNVKYVKIMRSTSGYPQTMNDGTFVFSTEVTVDTEYDIYDTSVSNGTKYYYSAFAYDDFNRYAKSTDSMDPEPVQTNIQLDKSCTFFGYAIYNGTNAPIGTKIRAFDPDGVFCGYVIVSTAGQYNVTVYGNTTDPGDNGAEEGDTITFYINGYQATTSGSPPTWTSQGSINTDITGGN
jgi:hypothetical protein